MNKYGILKNLQTILCSQSYKMSTVSANTMNKTNEHSWKDIVREAEQIVGYPTSFLNLRWLLSDEFANITVNMSKLVGTGHPLLKTIRNLLLQNDTPTWGLILLLVSKAGGLNKTFSDNEKDASTGILHSQRILAEVTEMIRTSNLIHSSIQHVDCSTTRKDDVYFGNKIALLCGDYLLSRSFKELANLRDQELNELMQTSLRDFVENQFLGQRDSQNKPVPSKRNLDQTKGPIVRDQFETKPFDTRGVLGYTKSEWTLRTILNGGSLLAKACQCTLKLANHGKEVQNKGYLLGKYIALTWEGYLEIEKIRRGDNCFSLLSAPVLFQLEREPELLEEIGKNCENLEGVDYDLIRRRVIEGGGLELARGLLVENAELAVECLGFLPDTSARFSLRNIVKNLL